MAHLGIAAAARNPPSVRELPVGTVTFLFTDVEGSTRLLHELGPDQYSEALTEHRRVLRQAFARHGGVEVDTQGDAFFVAFPTAPGLPPELRELLHDPAVQQIAGPLTPEAIRAATGLG